MGCCVESGNHKLSDPTVPMPEIGDLLVLRWRFHSAQEIFQLGCIRSGTSRLIELERIMKLMIVSMLVLKDSVFAHPSK